jgi:flagellar export protein FliJ
MYRFRLARVLDYRRLRQERLERDLYQRRHQLQQEEIRLTALQDNCRQIEQQLSTSQGATLCADDVLRWRCYYQLLEHRIATQKDIVAAAVKALAGTRQDLLLARQEKKVLEKLGDKAYQQYIQEHTHREQQRLDELAITRSRYGL